MENEVKEPVSKYNFVYVQDYLSKERVTGYCGEYNDEYIVPMVVRPFRIIER